MLRRQVGRAITFAAAAVLIAAGVASADSVGADGDHVATGVQTFVDLGTVAPGAVIDRDVDMTLFCSGLHHVDPGQVLTVAQTGSTVPSQGGSITATSTTVGPVPGTWADDTAGISGCSGPFTVTSAVPSHVEIVAPTVSGAGYMFTATYGRTLAPAGVSDATSTSGFTSVTFLLAVADADGTPPVFDATAPDLEATTSDLAGTAVTFATPTATDDRDPNPEVSCDPASGATFPIGTTTVTCTAADVSGNSATTSFEVTVHLASVAWDDPVQVTDVMATYGRNVPVKVRAWLDGVAVGGPASLAIAACDAPGVIEGTVALSRQSDRWMGGLDTSMLSPGCHQVWLVANGLALDAFHLEVVAPPKTTTTTAQGRNGRRNS